MTGGNVISIIVMSENQAESLFPLDNHAWISITDPGSKETNLQTNDFTKGVLRLQFDDMEKGEDWHQSGYDLVFHREVSMMTEDMAEAIFEFSHKMKGQIEDLFIHCHAGMCRSTAVASVLARLWGLDTSEFWFPPRQPNTHVRNTMIRFWLKKTGQLII